MIEAPSYAAQGSHKAALWGQQYVVRHWLNHYGVPFDTIAAKSLKKKATGNGNADKLDMIGAAKEFWRECYCDDLADAMFLAKVAYDEYGERVEQA